MPDWLNELDFLAGKARRQIRGAAHAIRNAVNDDPFEVLAYRGFGNSGRAHIYGRALEVRNVSVSTDSDSTWRNLLNTYRRADADPIPFAQVKLEFASTTQIINADDEGFFSGWIELEGRRFQ